jgi:hypothetical protein
MIFIIMWNEKKVEKLCALNFFLTLFKILLN